MYFKKASGISKTYVQITYKQLMQTRRNRKRMHIMRERETKIDIERDNDRDVCKYTNR